MTTQMSHLLAAGQTPVPPGVHRIQGDVRVNGRPAHVGLAVLPGDTVTTGARSEAVYVMGANAYLMRENTKVGFFADTAVSVLRVLSGKVLSVFGPGERRVETPTATAGIRGTACYVEAEPERVYFCLCYGMADLLPLGDPAQAQTITTRYHDRPFYIRRSGQGPLLEPAPVINHSDAELTMLEALVGRRPPFYGQENLPYRY